MCCDGKDKMKPEGQTQMQGGMGQPVGFEVDPSDFLNPGSGFGEGDVMGAIFARMKMSDEDGDEMPHGDEELDPRALSMGGMA